MLRVSLALLVALVCLAVASAVWFIYANFRGWVYLPPLANVVTGVVFSLIVTSMVLAIPAIPVYVVASLWPGYVRERRQRLGLCWNCAYVRSVEPGPCSECGRQQDLPSVFMTYRRLIVVSLCLVVAGVMGAVLGELSIRSEDLQFRAQIKAYPMLRHNHDRAFPACGFSLQYAPDRGVWVND